MHGEEYSYTLRRRLLASRAASNTQRPSVALQHHLRAPVSANFFYLGRRRLRTYSSTCSKAKVHNSNFGAVRFCAKAYVPLLNVTFFGKGPMEQSLKRLARELGVEGKVRFAGHVAEIQQVWTQHHALVLPSRFEGLPIALVEAMLCSRPAIVTDFAGNAELVGKNGECGFVATAPTVTAVADAMERAWQSRMRWQAMGQTASHQVRSQIPRDPIGECCQKLEAVIRVRP